jgi:anaerobic dimethyl sulfoxide reductase subunit C
MIENFSSLVFFTVLSQTAVGTLIFRWLFLLRHGTDSTPGDFRKISLLVIAFLLIISLAIAFLHTGKPSHAIYALRNLGKSWLSREIFSLSFLIAVPLIYLLFISGNDNGRIDTIVSLIAVIAGVSFIYCMIRLYMIPSVTTWNSPYTPVSFIITTFLCGILLMTIISGEHGQGLAKGSLAFVVFFILCSMINSLLSGGPVLKHELTLFSIRVAISVLSLVLIAVIYFNPVSNKARILQVILFIMVIISEIINRYIFFISFEKSGL